MVHPTTSNNIAAAATQRFGSCMPQLRLANNEADVSSSITDWTDFSHTEDISGVDAGLHEVTIGIQISSGSGTMYARKITVIAGPY